jgi:hypothetical protein
MTSEHRFDVHNANHVIEGDIIQQYGPGSVGKQVHTGPGDNVVNKTGPTGPVPPQTVIVHGGDYVASTRPPANSAMSVTTTGGDPMTHQIPGRRIASRQG